MVVAEDTTTLKKIMEQERVFEFLAGLNPELDQLGSEGGSNRGGKPVTRSGQAATIDLDTPAEIPTAKPPHALSSKQDQITRRMIGHGERKGGLYYLNIHWKICDSIPTSSYYHQQYLKS
ncbi:hypothetical protein CK203_045759 [Vitis vinifera]|uniref:Uncharacterized protein n=1 Tax=Vitis vinifera TaxID=29760 RepID=A0A438I107_VITVI|nr:hypothetical protein CK203_045759 [Vitis vinifera]